MKINHQLPPKVYPQASNLLQFTLKCVFAIHSLQGLLKLARIRSPALQVWKFTAMVSVRLSSRAFRCLKHTHQRTFSSSPLPNSPFAPRHLLSIADLSHLELTRLVTNALSYKQTIKSGQVLNRLSGSLTGSTIAMIFSKLSTRTRVSTEAAVVTMGGHPMFLGRDTRKLPSIRYL